jgi:hypothetical protein
LFIDVFAIFLCCSSWNVGAHIKSSWWSVVSWIFLVHDENGAKLLNKGRMHLVGRGDKYVTMTKAKHCGF